MKYEAILSDKPIYFYIHGVKGISCLYIFLNTVLLFLDNTSSHRLIYLFMWLWDSFTFCRNVHLVPDPQPNFQQFAYFLEFCE